jgi:hypothetical protein
MCLEFATWSLTFVYQESFQHSTSFIPWKVSSPHGCQCHVFAHPLLIYSVIQQCTIVFQPMHLNHYSIMHSILDHPWCCNGIHCVPAYASQSLFNYVLYSGSPMMLQWNDKSQKYIQSTWRGIGLHLRNFVLFLTVTGLLKSILAPFHYQPFYQATSQWYNISRLLHVGQLGNNILHARESRTNGVERGDS